MGKNSGIEWTNHTFNPWWGCTKISEACRHCYAEVWSKRTGVAIWGPTAGRRFFGEEHWRQPLIWNKEAKVLRKRKRVFCASMADILEDRPDLEKWRIDLWNLIRDTPWLDWLLLTKRPENFTKMVPWHNTWPENVWIGTTAENQERAKERIPVLLKFPAVVRFISCEPLLGPIDLSQWLNHREQQKPSINWVIVGGESGHKARPMHPSWVRKIRDQCLALYTPFNFKQWGCWQPTTDKDGSSYKVTHIKDDNPEPVAFIWRGKKAAGRFLDGQIWDGIPNFRN